MRKRPRVVPRRKLAPSEGVPGLTRARAASGGAWRVADAATQTDARGADGFLDESAMALANSRADATRDALVVFDADGVGAFTRALAIPSRALAALTRNSDHAAAHRRVAVAARVAWTSPRDITRASPRPRTTSTTRGAARGVAPRRAR